MANVNEVRLCPNLDCGAPLPIPEPDKCLSCGSLLRSPENKFFLTPDYLTMQLSDQLIKAKEDHGKNPTDYANAVNDIWSHYFAWLKVMPEDDMSASLRDVKAIFQHLVLSNVKVSTLGTMVYLGKEIGKLAGTLDDYMKAGGQVSNYEHLKMPLPEAEKQGGETF